MKKYHIIRGSVAEQMLQHDYASVLSEASAELSESEYKHLADIAGIGFEYAAQKDDYLDALHETVFGWVVEARREQFYLIQDSMEIDLKVLYNAPDEVKRQMDANQDINVIPTFFVFFGAIVLALFCISATIFAIGISQNTFPINPVYLFMIVVGFGGLFLTDIVAIAEWRKSQDEQK